MSGLIIRKKLQDAIRPRVASDVLAHDFASVRNDKRLMKSVDHEELLFSEECTKTNHQGRRQRRLVVLTSEALYIFKKDALVFQKRLALDSIELLILSIENPTQVVIRVSGDLVTGNSIHLELTRRNAFTKTVREAKHVKLVKIVEVNHAVMERAFKESSYTLQEMVELQRVLSGGGGALMLPDLFEEEEGSSAAAAPAMPPPPAPRGSSLKARLSIRVFEKKPAAPPPLPPQRKLKKKVQDLIRRASLLDPASNPTSTYFPRCPPCRVALGVVQPIWSLVERALEPLLDLDVSPASGLVRCADILLKLVGETGPGSALEAIKAIAALCFDKDAARGLLQSLAENVPVLGGSALVDSLDALQRCESVEVRTWAIKSLWKLLPLCMTERALPLTSPKWMAALNELDEFVANEGEAWFIKTYFRGKIKVVEKEPLRRIAAKRRASSDSPFSPLQIQQAFSQVLLQNMFDVARRAAFSQRALQQHQQQRAASSSSAAAAAATEEEEASSSSAAEVLILSGVSEQDCTVVMELLLNSLSRPNQPEVRHVEVTGKRIAHTVLLPALMGMLVLVEGDGPRQRLVKDVSLLLLRSETNLRSVLDIPDWPLLFVPLLQTIPKEETRRSSDQTMLYKYVLNLLTMIHTFCFKDTSASLYGMLGVTFKSLALFGDWTPETCGVARWVLLGLTTQLSQTARLWWHEPESPEWLAFGHVVRMMEEFVFFRKTRSVTRLKKESATGGSSGEEEEDQNVRALGKRRKRKFSITPVYELRGFAPVILPLSPHEASQVETDNGLQQQHNVAKNFGLHLAEDTGRPLDIALVETGIEVLKRMGVTGNPPEDLRRADLVKTASKKQKANLRFASEWCQTLQAIRDLLVDVDSALAHGGQPDAVRGAMDRIEMFCQARLTLVNTTTSMANATTTTSATPNTKLAATKLSTTSTTSRLAAKQSLNKSQRTLVVLTLPKLEVIETKSTTQPPPPLPSKSSLNRQALQHKKRNTSVVVATFLSSTTSAIPTDEVSLPPPPPYPFVEEVCTECGEVANEFDLVRHHEAVFHPACFCCDECRRPLLKGENPEENNVFFQPKAKFCTPECRMSMLKRLGDQVCPGCMECFTPGEQATRSCGKLFHLAHLQCFECGTSLGSSPHIPVTLGSGEEVWPFCAACHEKRYKTCAKCNQAIGEAPAYEALGRVFHQNHFNCFRCGENFMGKTEFFVEGVGDSARALCPPCFAHDSGPLRLTCEGCNQEVVEGEEGIELQGQVFHARCFQCRICHTLVDVGEVFEGTHVFPVFFSRPKRHVSRRAPSRF